MSSQLFAAGVNHAFLVLKKKNKKTVIEKILGSDVCGASLTWETQMGVTVFLDTGKVKNITIEWLYWDSRG